MGLLDKISFFKNAEKNSSKTCNADTTSQSDIISSIEGKLNEIKKNNSLKLEFIKRLENLKEKLKTILDKLVIASSDEHVQINVDIANALFLVLDEQEIEEENRNSIVNILIFLVEKLEKTHSKQFIAIGNFIKLFKTYVAFMSYGNLYAAYTEFYNLSKSLFVASSLDKDIKKEFVLLFENEIDTYKSLLSLLFATFADSGIKHFLMGFFWDFHEDACFSCEDRLKYVLMVYNYRKSLKNNFSNGIFTFKREFFNRLGKNVDEEVSKLYSGHEKGHEILSEHAQTFYKEYRDRAEPIFAPDADIAALLKSIPYFGDSQQLPENSQEQAYDELKLSEARKEIDQSNDISIQDDSNEPIVFSRNTSKKRIKDLALSLSSKGSERPPIKCEQMTGGENGQDGVDGLKNTLLSLNSNEVKEPEVSGLDNEKVSQDETNSTMENMPINSDSNNAELTSCTNLSSAEETPCSAVIVQKENTPLSPDEIKHLKTRVTEELTGFFVNPAKKIELNLASLLPDPDRTTYLLHDEKKLFEDAFQKINACIRSFSAAHLLKKNRDNQAVSLLGDFHKNCQSQCDHIADYISKAKKALNASTEQSFWARIWAGHFFNKKLAMELVERISLRPDLEGTVSDRVHGFISMKSRFELLTKYRIVCWPWQDNTVFCEQLARDLEPFFYLQKIKVIQNLQTKLNEDMEAILKYFKDFPSFSEEQICTMCESFDRLIAETKVLKEYMEEKHKLSRELSSDAASSNSVTRSRQPCSAGTGNDLTRRISENIDNRKIERKEEKKYDLCKNEIYQLRDAIFNKLEPKIQSVNKVASERVSSVSFEYSENRLFCRYVAQNKDDLNCSDSSLTLQSRQLGRN